MSYKLTNLSGTRRDPNKRGHKSPLVRRAAGGLRIGHRPLKAGATISIDESDYQANKDHIDAHIAAGVIKLEAMGEAAERAEARVHAPSPTPPEPPPTKVEISPASSSEESEEGSVFSKMKSTILNMASSEEPPKQEAAPEKETAPKKKTVAKKTYESSEAKESRSRRRKKKSEDE